MIVIKNKIIPFGRYDAMVIWPFIFAKKEMKEKLINHERIHGRQQVEMLLLPFFLWYVVEFILRKLFGIGNAYRNISFEQEAYDHQQDVDYLQHRKLWAWTKYL